MAIEVAQNEQELVLKLILVKQDPSEETLQQVGALLMQQPPEVRGTVARAIEFVWTKMCELLIAPPSTDEGFETSGASVQVLEARCEVLASGSQVKSARISELEKEVANYFESGYELTAQLRSREELLGRKDAEIAALRAQVEAATAAPVLHHGVDIGAPEVSFVRAEKAWIGQPRQVNADPRASAADIANAVAIPLQQAQRLAELEGSSTSWRAQLEEANKRIAQLSARLEQKDAQVAGLVENMHQMDSHDIWQLQGTVMEMSDQHLPVAICLTPQSLLYFALQGEELAEQGIAIHGAIRDGFTPFTDRTRINDLVSFSQLAERILTMSTRLDAETKQLRASIKSYFAKRTPGDVKVPRVVIALSDAIKIADGAADVAVTNAGFSLSCGIPGAAVFAEVTKNNITKANPDTGKIDKEPDGKWIKGRNWVEPNLGDILASRLLTINAAREED